MTPSTALAPPFFAANPADIPENGFRTDGRYVFETHGNRAYLHNPHRKAEPNTQGTMVHFSIHPHDVNWAWKLISRVVAESDIAIGSVVLDDKVKQRFDKARVMFADTDSRKTITLKDDRKFLHDWIAILKKIENLLAAEKIRPGHAVNDSIPLNGSQYAYQNPLNDIAVDAIDVSDVYDAPDIEPLDIPMEFSEFDTLEETFFENSDTMDTEIIELESEIVFDDLDDEINHLHEMDPSFDALPEFEELATSQLEDMLSLPLQMIENPETGEVHMEMDISDPDLFAPDDVHDARAAMKHFNIGTSIQTDAAGVSKLIVAGDGMNAFFNAQKRYVQSMAKNGYIEMGHSINGAPIRDEDGKRMANTAHIHFDPLLRKDDPYARPPKQAWALSQSLYRLDRHHQWENNKPIEPMTLDTRPWQMTGYASRPWTEKGIDTRPQNAIGIVTNEGLMKALNQTVFNRSAAPSAQPAASVPMHRPAA